MINTSVLHEPGMLGKEGMVTESDQIEGMQTTPFHQIVRYLSSLPNCMQKNSPGAFQQPSEKCEQSLKCNA